MEIKKELMIFLVGISVMAASIAGAAYGRDLFSDLTQRPVYESFQNDAPAPVRPVVVLPDDPFAEPPAFTKDMRTL